jgi:hypothetical protein
MGDAGSWNYSLAVTGDSIAQGSPTSGSTSTTNSSTFTAVLAATSGIPPVSFVTNTSGFVVNSGDQLASTGSLSASGSPYVVTETDTDAYGDAGTWTYSLTVTSPSSSAPGSTLSLVQTSPTTETVQNTASGVFTAGSIAVQNSIGAVTLVTTASSPDLTVSASGLIATTGTLSLGTYIDSGTDSDAHGDTGSWSFTLTVAFSWSFRLSARSDS